MALRKTQTIQYDAESQADAWETDARDAYAGEAEPFADAADGVAYGDPYDPDIAPDEEAFAEQEGEEAPFVYYDNEKHASSRPVNAPAEDREVSADQFDYTELERKALEEGQDGITSGIFLSEQEVKEREKRQKKRQRKNRWRMARKKLNPVAVVVILLILIGGFAAARNIITLQLEHHRLVQENRELMEKRDNLKIELKNVNSQEYIEQQARRQLRLVNPDEILFVFDNGEEDGANGASADASSGETD